MYQQSKKRCQTDFVLIHKIVFIIRKLIVFLSFYSIF